MECTEIKCHHLTAIQMEMYGGVLRVLQAWFQNTFPVSQVSVFAPCKKMKAKCCTSEEKKNLDHGGLWVMTLVLEYDECEGSDVWCWEKGSACSRTKEMKVSECIIQESGVWEYLQTVAKIIMSFKVCAKYWSGLKCLEKLISTELLKRAQTNPNNCFWLHLESIVCFGVMRKFCVMRKFVVKPL